MKKLILTFALLLVTNISVFASEPFTLSSPQVKNGTIATNQVYNNFGCKGKNISPSLEWKNPPEGTQSFAITMFDVDAPTGSGWWHWIVYNIPASTSSLVLGAGNDPKKLPKGAVQSINDFGFIGFGGPCPPIGAKPHHYIFTIYALNVETMDLPATTMPAAVGFNIHMHMIDKATFTATYSRK